MRIHSLKPALECENDVGGRFTKYPLDDSQQPRSLRLGTNLGTNGPSILWLHS